MIIIAKTNRRIPLTNSFRESSLWNVFVWAKSEVRHVQKLQKE